MDKKWNKIEDIILKDGSYYELCFWCRPTVYEDGSRMEGNFKKQGIVKCDGGFKDSNDYWIKPSPTHVKRIELTTPITPRGD